MLTGDKDYRVIVKVKNANLLREIEKAGYKTVGGFCRINNLRPTDVGDLANLKISPSRGRGLALMEKISQILNVPMFRLFSEDQEEPLAKNTGSVDMSREEMLPMLAPPEQDPLQQLINSEQIEQLDDAMSTLLPQHQEVLRQRFGLDCERKTLREVGRSLNVSEERVRMIEAKALRNLRRRLPQPEDKQC